MIIQDGMSGNITDVTLKNSNKLVDMADKSKKNYKKVTKNESRNSNTAKAKSSTKSSKSPNNEAVPNSTNNSYLVRVKSKIYRTKGANNTAAPSMPEISENTKEKKNKSKVLEARDEVEPNLRNSVSHFDFRLIRQTSNLESIKPSLLGSKKSLSNVIVDGVDGTSEKPVLAKSKSSSSINLNLLRTRRNKLMEHIRKNSKSVQDEFDFISFSNIQNAGINRTFGSQNLINTLSETVYRRPVSWLHRNTGKF